MKKKHLIIGIAIIAIGIILDQIIKIVVRTNMTLSQKIVCIPRFFYITYFENTGAAWGIFSNNTIFLIVISIILLFVFAYMYRKIDFNKEKLYSCSLTLIISGLIGNLIDRIVFRSVTDYLDFYIFGYDFPIFNLADSLLVVGFFVYAASVIVSGRKKNEEDKNEGTNSTEEWNR